MKYKGKSVVFYNKFYNKSILTNKPYFKYNKV